MLNRPALPRSPRPCGLGYIDGLKVAERLCAERSKRAIREGAVWKTETDKASCMTTALEALECAIAIKELIEAAPREETNDG